MDKYPLHAQMYARMFLKSKQAKRNFINAHFMGGDDASVDKLAQQCKVNVSEILKAADDYLADDSIAVG